MNVKAIDMECLMSTQQGAVSRDPAMIDALKEYFKTSGMRIKTEDEQAQDWRDAGVQVVLLAATGKPFGFTEFDHV